ncbi:MAG: cardiolipin synthase [Gemmatimonadales bacterium]
MALILSNAWPHIVTALIFALAVIASAHAILSRRDVRSTLGWVGVVWLVPVFGPVLYSVFGINRIKRRATQLRAGALRFTSDWLPSSEEIAAADQVSEVAHHLVALERLVRRVTERSLTRGNSVRPLVNGEEAFPAMIGAIDAAERTVALSTYVFNHDPAGEMFVAALARAVRRGVEVRVLIDAVGARYSRPPIAGTLRQRGIQVARFLRTVLPWRMQYMNMRNHRKLLVTDGQVGFTGGMNISKGNFVRTSTGAPIQDVHFCVTGPVVAHMLGVFAEDWASTAGEVLAGEGWFPSLDPVGRVLSRGLSDGPDIDIDKLPLVLMGALSCARESIRIVTPYFLPDESMITALNVAALRGVDVCIVLPEVNNLPPVAWAATAQLPLMLERGCRFFLSPGPFDHSKLLIVDEVWSLVGSANWDPRSFRLNFEFNLECYDRDLAGSLARLADDKAARGRPVTLADVARRGFPTQLRDGIARLASPYL